MLVHWIWLATRPDMSDREKVTVLRHFQDPEELFFASEKDLSGLEEVSEDAAQALADKNLIPAEEIVAQCLEKGIHICTFHDAGYPRRLKNISDPPLVLYYKGNLPDFDGQPMIAVVGTRKATPYGMSTAKRMGFQISRCGGTVVSGLAFGIDGVAMSGALTAGAPVVGVLGCGADVIYPASSKSLYADTERCGCLLTEFPPGTPPLKWNFPKRNRIISGLCDGVVVVEAPEKSGALITARRAADQGRDVFVVPGNIDVPTCVGSNALLRDGAIAVSSGWDVVSEYEHLYPGKLRKDLRPVHLTAYDAEMAAAVSETEKEMPKVAQKTASPGKKRPFDKKKEKKPIDNGEQPPYSDVVEIPQNLNETEQQILQQLAAGEQLVDDVIAATGLGTGKVLASLTLLEVKGLVRRLPGKRVARK